VVKTDGPIRRRYITSFAADCKHNAPLMIP